MPIQTDTANDSTEGAEISFRTPQPPLLCAGFEGSIIAGVVKDLFEFGKGDDDGIPNRANRSRLGLILFFNFRIITTHCCMYSNSSLTLLYTIASHC